MNIKLWDRTEPLKSVAIWAVGVLILIEATLLLGGKWVLVGQEINYDSDYFVDNGQEVRATRSWTILTCTYWTGRSSQQVEHSHEFDEHPRECPFITSAQ